MKKSFLTEYLLYSLFRFFAVVFQWLPVKLSLAAGRKLGAAGEYLNLKRRSIAYSNLKCALGHKYEPYQLKKILKQTYVNIGQALVETLLLPKLNKKYAQKNFTYVGFENIDNALKKGKGVILLTAHFGNWELSNAALPFKGYCFKAIAREQKPFLINRLLNAYRESHGCKIISKGMPLREIIKALKNNEVVGMLVDQDAGKTGVFVDLFNKPASWHRGVMEFGLSTGCVILPGFPIRQGPGKFKFIVNEPIIFPGAGSKEEKMKEGFRQFAARLEEMILKYPDQWLWQHKRWKSSPQKKIVVLDDSRTGHLRQSQAALKQIRELFIEKGISESDILTEVIPVKFKNSFFREMLCVESYFVTPLCQGCMVCLRTYLNRQTYKRLMKVSADIIISCGSKIAPVNLLLSKECRAKSVVIMNPGAFLVKRFNLCVIPRHDQWKKMKNVIITEGAPNLIDRKLVEYQANALRYELKGAPTKKFNIGLLLGGDYKNFRMQEDVISSIIEQVKNASCAVDAGILATTSRRTPQKIEKALSKQLSGDERCKLLIIANQENREGAVGGILGVCDVVVISPDSISMVSEAASSGCQVLVFDAGSAIDRRHRLFLANLGKKGYIKLVEHKDISRHIKEFFKDRTKVKALDDNPVIREGLRKII
ncbi:MAG: ELM1/GtrOC1 family putative glycosyltransferase [Candidatus Omnitrophota bacterium]